jgi:uncharacterized membrane protein YraQ (UPF0718 family)
VIGTLTKTLFLVSAGLAFAITLSTFIRPESIDWVKQNINTPLLIIYAELIGFIAPGPRYIIYPILVKLAEMNVGTGVIIALIGGHVLIEPSTCLVETGFFGWRFPLKRFIVSFIITFLAGIITVLLEIYCGLNIL